MRPTKILDVFSYGVVSSSTLYRLKNPFPQAQGYSEIREAHQILGGEAANSSLVLARLGLRVKLDGSWLDRNGAGDNVQRILKENGVDVSRLRSAAGGAGEVVFSDETTRTIFGTYGRMLSQRQWNKARRTDITRCRVANVDPFFGEDSFAAAKIAAAHGIPVVTVDCRDDNTLLEHSQAAVVADSFLEENYKSEDREKLLKKYLNRAGGLMIFTFGAQGVWYARRGGRINRQAAYQVKPVDTTGGGDAFRAGIVFGILKKWDDEKTIRFAGALAAVACTRYPGVVNSPGLRAVQQFLKNHS